MMDALILLQGSNPCPGACTAVNPIGENIIRRSEENTRKIDPAGQTDGQMQAPG